MFTEHLKQTQAYRLCPGLLSSHSCAGGVRQARLGLHTLRTSGRCLLRYPQQPCPLVVATEQPPSSFRPVIPNYRQNTPNPRFDSSLFNSLILLPPNQHNTPPQCRRQPSSPRRTSPRKLISSFQRPRLSPRYGLSAGELSVSAVS